MGYWPLTSKYREEDVSGRNGNGVLNSVTVSQPITSHSGGSFSFSAQSSSSILIFNKGQLVTSSAFSIILHVNPSDVTSSQNLLFWTKSVNSSQVKGLSIQLLSGGYLSLTDNYQSWTSPIFNEVLLPQNTWSRIAISCDLVKSSLQVWLNDNLLVSVSNYKPAFPSAVTTDGDIYVGNYDSVVKYSGFSGQLSCLKIFSTFIDFSTFDWNKELSQCFGQYLAWNYI